MSTELATSVKYYQLHASRQASWLNPGDKHQLHFQAATYDKGGVSCVAPDHVDLQYSANNGVDVVVKVVVSRRQLKKMKEKLRKARTQMMKGLRTLWLRLDGERIQDERDNVAFEEHEQILLADQANFVPKASVPSQKLSGQSVIKEIFAFAN